MANFFEDVGSFFKNLGTGITTTVQGFGSNLQSQADLNKAQAEQIQANAQATMYKLTLDDANKKRQQELMLYALIVIAAVPIVGMILYFTLKK
jgi:hypothetical protein